MKILVIEDEKKVASFIKRGLKENNYTVDVAYDGEKGLFMAETNPYDLIVLDLMLPKKDGLTLCKERRGKNIQTPVLMLTAKDTVKDKVTGFEVGADDYLTKPFAFEEFLARVKVLLKRRDKPITTKLKVGDLELDQLTRKVTRAGKEIELTSTEFSLLEFLMLNANQVVTRTMISEHVWHDDFDHFSNVIDVYINYLRNKIDKGFPKKLIHSIRGTGYTIKE